MLEIIYQDEHFVAVNKPAGMLVHRSWLDKHETQFVMQTLRDQLGQHVFPLHRLDRPTSGVLMFALSSEVASQAMPMFAGQAMEKTYHAIVRGWIEEGASLITHSKSSWTKLLISLPLKKKKHRKRLLTISRCAVLRCLIRPENFPLRVIA